MIKKIPKKIDIFFNDYNNRVKLQKRYKDAFADNTRLKFPLIDPFTGKFNRDIAYRSRSRAMLWIDKVPKNLKLPNSYYKNIVVLIDKKLKE